MENPVYDAAIAQRQANRLYFKAKIIVIQYTVISAILFSVIFYYAASYWNTFGLLPTKSLGVGLLIGVVLGVFLGQRKYYQLMREVQLALCLIQIEKNTSTVVKANS